MLKVSKVAERMIAALPTQNFDAEVSLVVGDLNQVWGRTGCEMSDISPVQKTLALKLDRQMTAAANRGDLATARKALHEWRACWIPEGRSA